MGFSKQTRFDMNFQIHSTNFQHQNILQHTHTNTPLWTLRREPSENPATFNNRTTSTSNNDIIDLTTTHHRHTNTNNPTIPIPIPTQYIHTPTNTNIQHYQYPAYHFLCPFSLAVTPPQRSFAPAAKPPQCVCCRNMVRISATEV